MERQRNCERMTGVPKINFAWMVPEKKEDTATESYLKWGECKLIHEWITSLIN